MNPAGNISDLEFLKQVFNLKGKVVGWAIVVETIDGQPGQKQVPGLWIKGSNKYVNIPERTFKSIGSIGISHHKVFPANRTVSGDYFVLTVKNNSKEQLRWPITYVRDIYFRTWYSESLEHELLI